MGTLLVDDDALEEVDGDLGLMRLRCAGVGHHGRHREGCRCIAWIFKEIGVGSKVNSFQRLSTTI